jgi:predicted nicotinamide N-methyase
LPALPAQYQTETREIESPGRSVSLVTVKNPDSLLDKDVPIVRVPYWAALWPSALALATHLAHRNFRGAPVLELGCGMGLTTISLARAGAVPLAIDYDPDALGFARHNLARDGGHGYFARMDWGQLAISQAFPYIVAADVLYERAQLSKISKLLVRYLSHGGEAIIAEPGREVAKEFFKNLSRYRLEAKSFPTQHERVTIHHISKLQDG